jgi:hypothetical protein
LIDILLGFALHKKNVVAKYNILFQSNSPFTEIKMCQAFPDKLSLYVYYLNISHMMKKKNIQLYYSLIFCLFSSSGVIWRLFFKLPQKFLEMLWPFFQNPIISVISVYWTRIFCIRCESCIYIFVKYFIHFFTNLK